MVKTFKTLDEQIEIMKAKGLIVNDYEETKKILFKENYFFINGYRKLFMVSFKERKFISGTTFDELYATFIFDRKIRNIMFKFILIVENNIKSILSYILSQKYGIQEKNYLDPKNFNQDIHKIRQVHDVLNKMNRQIRNNIKQHTATVHYLSNYGYIPLWILVKVLSLGIIAELYNILKLEDQKNLGQIYNLDVETLSIYLNLLANFRNLCAHEDILFDYKTQRKIPDNQFHHKLNIEITDNEYSYGKNDLFALIIIMKQMLSKSEFDELIFEVGYEMDILDGKIKVVPTNCILNKMGFPTNWRDIVDMDLGGLR